MTDQNLYACQDCDFQTDDWGAMHDIQDIAERVSPDEVVPPGQCPQCGALMASSKPDLIMKNKFNTMFDIAFSIDHNCEDPHDVPDEILIAALSDRLDHLRANPQEAAGAFGVCDTYEN
jgi:hypothetical protein